MVPDSDIDRNLGIAYLSCVLRGVPRHGFERAMAYEYVFLTRMMASSSLPARLSRATAIKCVIDSIEFEESSKRFVIDFTADGCAKPEAIRSDRVDSRMGSLVREIWRPDLVGGRALVYKLNEGSSGPGSHGYRVAPYVIPLH